MFRHNFPAPIRIQEQPTTLQSSIIYGLNGSIPGYYFQFSIKFPFFRTFYEMTDMITQENSDGIYGTIWKKYWYLFDRRYSYIFLSDSLRLFIHREFADFSYIQFATDLRNPHSFQLIHNWLDKYSNLK